MKQVNSPPSPKRSATLVTYRDVARALKCSTRHVENLIGRDPNFPVIRLGRSVRFDLNDVIAYVKERSRKPTGAVDHHPLSNQPSEIAATAIPANAGETTDDCVPVTPEERL